jgi:hypothetical protein
MVNENEVNIFIKQIQNIFIFECTEFRVDEFLKKLGLIVRSRQPIRLDWAEGVIFSASPYQPKSDIIIKEALKGNIYWSSVLFALMPEYKQLIKFGAFEVPVINQEKNSTLRQVGLWLAKQSKKRN